MEWGHLRREKIIGTNKRLAWVWRPKEEWLEGVQKAEKQTNQMTRAKISIIDNLVKDMTAAEITGKTEGGG